MKTKIVYVLTSTGKDYYLEQVFMSVYSARLHNPDATLCLATDTQTAETCKDGLRKKFIEQFDEVKAIEITDYPRPKERSRVLKTTLRQIIEGDYLFIDGDTIICDSLEEIDNTRGAIANVLDLHLEKPDWPVYFTKAESVRFFGPAEVDKHFNSGVMYVKDCPETHEFYRQWHLEWRKAESQGNPQDQPPLHTVIQKTGFEIEELEGIWNCQMWGNFLPYLHRVKILHTFADSPYLDTPCLFRDAELLKEMRDHGDLTERVKQLIDNPHESFHKIQFVLGRESTTLVRMPLMRYTTYMYKHYRPLYNMVEGFAYIMRRLCDAINYIRVRF